MDKIEIGNVTASETGSGGTEIQSKLFGLTFNEEESRALATWLVERYALPGWTPKRGDYVEPTREGDAWTLGQVDGDVDSEGDVRVHILNGDRAGECGFYSVRYLRRSTTPVHPVNTLVVFVATTGCPVPAGTPAVITKVHSPDWYTVEIMEGGKRVPFRAHANKIALRMPSA